MNHKFTDNHDQTLQVMAKIYDEFRAKGELSKEETDKEFMGFYYLISKFLKDYPQSYVRLIKMYRPMLYKHSDLFNKEDTMSDSEWKELADIFQKRIAQLTVLLRVGGDVNNVS